MKANSFFKDLTDVCHNLLFQNKRIMAYLKNERCISDETISIYKLGSFPDDLRYLYKEHNLDPVQLKENNIIWNADHSQFKMYPLVIPIYDIQKNPIAIGCRTLLTDNERKQFGIPKYRNSSYKKASNLFLLDHAYKNIRKLDKVFVVEGYFDAIMAHQCGIKNVVATCGTIFSEKQLIVLSRYTNNICLLFDNDEAGKLNTKRIIAKIGNISGINIKYKFVPNGYKDLDEFLRKCGNNNINDL